MSMSTNLLRAKPFARRVGRAWCFGNTALGEELKKKISSRRWRSVVWSNGHSGFTRTCIHFVSDTFGGLRSMVGASYESPIFMRILLEKSFQSLVPRVIKVPLA